MAGVKRSLLRRLKRAHYENHESWTDVAHVSADAIADLGEDPKTSFWDDDLNSDMLDDVLLSLALERTTISAMDYGRLWQNDLNANLESRILQINGTGPYAAGQSRHYELQEPRIEDYPHIGLAIAKRDDFGYASPAFMKDLIEEALVTGKFNKANVDPLLEKLIDKMWEKRFVAAGTLVGRLGTIAVVDIRVNATMKIQGSTFANEAKLVADGYVHGIGTNNETVIVCADGTTSRLVAKALRPKCASVETLVDGFDAWVRDGHPTVPA
jgi:rhodanese-related sulfurtransferase